MRTQHRGRGCTQWVAGVLATLAASEAHAQLRPFVALEYVATARNRGCLSEPMVREYITNALGADPFIDPGVAGSGAVTHLRIAVWERGRRLGVSVFLRPHDAPREEALTTLRAPRRECLDVLRSMATAVAHQLRPLYATNFPNPTPPTANPAEGRRDFVAPTTVPQRGEAPRVIVIREVEPSPTRAVATPAAPWHMLATVGGGISWGVAPGWGLALGASVGARRGAWSLLAEARFEAPRAAEHAVATLETWAALGGATGCYQRWLFGACVFARAGAVVARDLGDPTREPERAPVAYAGLGAYVHLPLAGPLAARAWVDGALALLRTRPWVLGAAGGETVVWESPFGAATAGVALALDFS